MTPEIKYIISEGLSENGLVVDVRMGEEPDQKRVDDLKKALEVVAGESDLWANLDKELAAALHALSFHLAGLVEGWKAQGKKWDTNIVENDFPYIYELIDEIFGV